MCISQPMVSVIMPVYNTGEYLRGTVESVLRQTYENFELLLVDDGSTDGSGALCDGFAAQDARVRVIHKPNGGICAARNAGLAQAAGELVAFCDHDDEMKPECLEKAVRALESSGAEIVRFRHEHVYIDAAAGKTISLSKPKEFLPETVAITSWSAYLKVIRSCGYGVWVGLYRRAFLERHALRFDETIRYGFEDHVFTARCCGCAARAALVPDVLYLWLQRDAKSTSCRIGEEIFSNRIEAMYAWANEEQEVAQRFAAPESDFNQQKYEYLRYMLSECDRLGLKGQEKRAFLRRCTAKLGIDVRQKGSEKLSLKMRMKLFCMSHGYWRLFRVMTWGNEMLSRITSKRGGTLPELTPHRAFCGRAVWALAPQAA